MIKVVIDCGLLAKLFIPEEGSDAAAGTFEKWRTSDAELWAPELLLIEFTNVMWHKVKRKELSYQLARANISDLLKLPINIAKHSILIEAAFRLAEEFNITAYDACYAALAHYLRAPFATADKKLATRLKESSIEIEIVA